MTISTREDSVASIVDIIVESSHPEKVILLGSRAVGGYSDESDYDFLIVVRDVDNEREISRLINRAILDKRVGIPVDILVVNEEKLRNHQDNPIYVYRRALREGIVYYERPRTS